MFGLQPFGFDTFGSFGDVAPVDPWEPIDVSLYAYLSPLLVDVAFYPEGPSQGAVYPAISYEAVDANPFDKVSGPSGLSSVLYEFSIWGTDYVEAVTLERSLRLLLNGYAGLMGKTAVRAVIWRDRDGQWERNPDGSDNRVYHVTVDYEILYTDQIPTFSTTY